MDKYYYINSTNQQVGSVSPQDFKRYGINKYLREQELNGLNSKVELINSWLNQMFICYQKENYKGVMEYANAIEKQKLEIRKIIE